VPHFYYRKAVLLSWTCSKEPVQDDPVAKKSAYQMISTLLCRHDNNIEIGVMMASDVPFSRC